MYVRIAPVLVLLTAAVPAAACSSSASSGSAPTASSDPAHVIPITISVGQCGAGWTGAVPGLQHFVLHNSDTRAGEVLLTDAKSAAVFADVEPLAAGTSTDLTITLGSGSYAFRCAMEDESTVVGRTVTIPGTTPQPVAPVTPVTQGDLIEATKRYQEYVSGRIPQLVRLTRALRSAIKGGDRPAAQRAWLQAHLTYERLGAAYDAFGDLDGTINGLPEGLPGGVRDRDWTGFHRVEYGLWHGEPSPSLLPQASRLLTAVQALGKQFADAQIDPSVISIRAHEITENALEFELTSRSDFGSGSALATIRANVAGTRVVMALIKPFLTTRYTELPTVERALSQTAADLDALRRPNTRRDATAGWPRLTSLTRAQRERVDADLSQLSELLAPVASILEPRRNS